MANDSSHYAKPASQQIHETIQKCIRCGTSAMSKNTTFCRKCGIPLVVACPRCRSPIGRSANFCGFCGLRLK
ncbi:MAG: double zinc ribbon domain-containing protein [Methanomassiliicoccaceae archaeon]